MLPGPADWLCTAIAIQPKVNSLGQPIKDFVGVFMWFMGRVDIDTGKVPQDILDKAKQP